MKIIKIDGSITRQNLRSNSFLIVSNGECCVIDPSFDCVYVDEILRANFGNEVAIRSVILTHCHADHCAELDTYDGAKVFLAPRTADALDKSDITLSDVILHKDKIALPRASHPSYLCEGDFEPISGVTASVRFTAGHTSDSISIVCGSDVFVGDLAFCGGGFGRCDLPTGDEQAIVESLRWLCSLAPQMTVHSGHGADFLVREFASDFSKMYTQNKR